jgi:phosphate-selective porin
MARTKDYTVGMNWEIDMWLRLQAAVVVAKKLIHATGMGIHDACKIAASRYNVDFQTLLQQLKGH